MTLGLQYRRKMKSAILIDALRDPGTRKALRRCYDEIMPGGSSRLHNRTSLSLYSGPTARLDGRIRPIRMSFPYCSPRVYPLYPLEIRLFPSGVAGWIGTGDADLNTGDIRDKWQSAYRGINEHVATLLLPHHGSWRNFHPDLLDFPNLQVCIASAERPSRYMHPSEETVESVFERKKVFVHVSQRVDSQFVEHISIDY